MLIDGNLPIYSVMPKGQYVLKIMQRLSHVEYMNGYVELPLFGPFYYNNH